jgi:hypothetical protein
MDVGPGGGQKSLYNRTINNAGLTTMNGRFEMLSSSVFNNLPTGVFDILIDGTIIGSGSTTPFNNAGLVVKSAGGGISTIRAPISNTGTVEVRTGTLLFGYPFVQTAGETILNGGNIATSNSPAPRLDGGRLRGSGTIGTGLNNVGGIVEPGLSVGSLTVAGSYVQGPGGAFRIEIGGLTPATEFDQLIQSGSGVMTLDGTIEILFVNGYVPEVDDSFVFATGLSRQGLFDDYIFEGLPSALTAVVNYTLTSAFVQILPSSPPNGDCNFSESPDPADLAVLVGCFAGPLPPNAPPIISSCRCVDMDLDDDVDLRDYAQFAKLYSP